MGDSLLDRVMKAKKDYEIGQVIIFNTGDVRTETNQFAQKMDNIYDRVELEMIMRDFCGATGSYARDCSFDTMKMALDLGLIYRAEDLDENNKVKGNAKPVNGIVRYYEGKFDSYLDGQKTNERDYGEYHYTTQGYIHYDKLVRALSGTGVEFTGPKSFEEFKKAIQAGEIFDISLVADLKKKEQGQRFGGK